MGWLATLLARYDGATLQAPSPHPSAALHAGQAAVFKTLRDWCRQPLDKAFAVALLTGPNGAGKTHLANALRRDMDGSVLLDACPTALARWRLKLRVKFDDCLWWRPRRSDHPWDAGYLRDDPAALQGLIRFVPRRATLIVADTLPATMLNECLAVLAQRQAEFRHPLRLLIVTPTPPDSLGEVFALELAPQIPAS